MNNVNVTGKIMQLTNKESEKGTMALGTISVYRNADKSTDLPVYDYIPFIAFSFNADRLSKGATVGLSGRMQSYKVPVAGEQYPETKIQLFVQSVDTFGGSNDTHESKDTHDNKNIHKYSQDIKVDSKQLPYNLFGGNR